MLDVCWTIHVTPARASPSDRLRPWLALIVLKQGEIDALAPPAGDLSHQKLTTKSGVPLPNVDVLFEMRTPCPAFPEMTS